MSADKLIVWFISLFCGVFCLADLLGNGCYYIGVWRANKKLNKLEDELGKKIPLFCSDTLLVTLSNTETFKKVETVVVTNGKDVKIFILRSENKND